MLMLVVAWKKNLPTTSLYFFRDIILMDKRAAEGRESLFTGAGRWDDDTSVVISTAVTSPEAEVHDA